MINGNDSNTIYIDGHSLGLSTVIKALSSDTVKVKLSDQARAICSQTREQVNEWLVEDAPVVYGINTGLGNLKDTVLSPEAHIEWNKTIPYPHAVGMGDLIDPVITRTALLLRANVLARGYSAVRVDLIERMLAVFNEGISPAIYELGSTGLSDLGPLAQSAMVIAGLPEADVIYNGQRESAQAVYERVGLEKEFRLECKEVLSQMNGSTMTQAISLHAFNGFEEVLAQIGPDLQTNNTDLYEAVQKTAEHIKQTINFENNITCDNPLLFEIGEGKYEPVMGCNCSNTQVGYAMDLLTMLTGDLSMWILEHLQSSNVKGDRGVSLMIQIDQLQIPASADSIATKGNQEDHVEFSYGAARKAKRAVSLLEELIY